MAFPSKLRQGELLFLETRSKTLQSSCNITSCNLPGCILASLPLYLMRTSSVNASGKSSVILPPRVAVETLAAVDKENRWLVFTRGAYIRSCTKLARKDRTTRWFFTWEIIIAQHLSVEFALCEDRSPPNPDTITSALFQRRWIALQILRGFLCFLVSSTIFAFVGNSLLCCSRGLYRVFRLVLSSLFVFLIFMLLLSLQILLFHKL